VVYKQHFFQKVLVMRNTFIFFALAKRPEMTE